MDWFLCNNGRRHERVNGKLHFLCSVENKFKRALRKIKTKLPQQDYIKLYPTGSSPGKFYLTAKKKHKMPENGTMEDLPLRPKNLI